MFSMIFKRIKRSEIKKFENHWTKKTNILFKDCSHPLHSFYCWSDFMCQIHNVIHVF